jgi:hypothetical protein
MTRVCPIAIIPNAAALVKTEPRLEGRRNMPLVAKDARSIRVISVNRWLLERMKSQMSNRLSFSLAAPADVSICAISRTFFSPMD